MAEASGQQPRHVIEPGTVNAPEFPPALSWLNTDEPLTIRGLRGKIVLLDFWTYCCINCMHALDDLKRLERKHPQHLVVIGVHSAKFTVEKDTNNIRQAILRYGIEHPVVNDCEMRVWQEYAVRAWPSFILIDPLGKVFGSHSGEQIFDLFDRVISQMVEHYESTGELRRGPLRTRMEAERVPDTVLSFPGKVLADEERGRLFIADTNRNRIVVVSPEEGRVLRVLGSGEAGFRDGSATEAQFLKPQGMALSEQTLFIADTGNHAIRVADLDSGAVSTVVGDGLRDTEWNNAPGPLEGRRLNSPWDLQLVHGVLFAAMAGNHQIFGIDLEGGFMAGHAGSGREDHVDGPLLAAALAQPSGLTTDGDNLFVADSEISSIRAVSLDPRGGHVRTVVGKGLFDFGDTDGVGPKVRMQHPMGVVYAERQLFVADTYNNKIKSVALPTLSVRTLAGSGAAGHRGGVGAEACFNEPAGLSYAGGKLFIADSNNHAIRVLDLETHAVSTLTLRDMARLIPPAGDPAVLQEQAVRAGSLTVLFKAELPDGHLFNPEAVSGLTMRVNDRTIPIALRNGAAEASFELTQGAHVRLEAMVYYCAGQRDKTCLYYHAKRILPLRVDPAGATEISVRLDVTGSWFATR